MVKKLANKTFNAMEEINAQVTSINEAITALDQIAFKQIFSLNVAKAMQQLEAGKDFILLHKR